MVMWRIRGRQIPVADWLKKHSKGSASDSPAMELWYVVGTLLAALFLGNSNELAAAILTLALEILQPRSLESELAIPPYNRCKRLRDLLHFRLPFPFVCL